MEAFLSGDGRYVRRFLDLWERTLAQAPKVAVQYPSVWRDDSGGVMPFWIPLEATTLEGLERLTGVRP